jgi:hypothetical protein
MTTTATQQTRSFKMHPALLSSVIKQQAGTLQKALLEGVMNSIDAGSSRVDVKIAPRQVTITDDGKGFQSMGEVAEFFETFGTPHVKGDATYGRFRMGRGQMFAFGHNVWRTGEFLMDIDIDAPKTGDEYNLPYTLKGGMEYVKGCQIVIDLYTPLGPYDMQQCSREISKMVKYAAAPVYINGTQVNEPPVEAKFKESTEDAFIRLSDANTLTVYNLGVLVREYHSSQFGVGGVVISKTQLEVNFARNDVMASCPVWKRIKKIVDITGAARVRTKTSLSDAEVENAISRVNTGDLKAFDIQNMKIFKDVTGIKWSPAAIAKAAFPTWSTASANDGVADKLIQHRQCLVLDESVISLFEGDVKTLLARLCLGRAPKHVPFGEASKEMRSEHLSTPPSLWSANERVWLSLMEEIQFTLFYTRQRMNAVPYARHDKDAPAPRSLRIGQSNTANAWTDGASQITFGREFLKKFFFSKYDQPNISDIINVALVLAHEMSHDTDSRENVHSGDFYRAYHDLSLIVPDIAARASARVNNKNLGKTIAAAKKRVETAKKRDRKADRAESETPNYDLNELNALIQEGEEAELLDTSQELEPVH